MGKQDNRELFFPYWHADRTVLYVPKKPKRKVKRKTK